MTERNLRFKISDFGQTQQRYEAARRSNQEDLSPQEQARSGEAAREAERGVPDNQQVRQPRK